MNSWAAWLHALSDCQLLSDPDSPDRNSLSRFNSLHSNSIGLSLNRKGCHGMVACRQPDRGKDSVRALSKEIYLGTSTTPARGPRRCRGARMNAVNFSNITISPGVRETASEDGAVLLDIEQGICFSLNPVGLKIWRMLKDQFSLDQMTDSLEEEFHTPRLELMADICQFVSQLEAKHLISCGASPRAKQGWWAKLSSRTLIGPQG